MFVKLLVLVRSRLYCSQRVAESPSVENILRPFLNDDFRTKITVKSRSAVVTRAVSNNLAILKLTLDEPICWLSRFSVEISLVLLGSKFDWNNSAPCPKSQI